MSDPYAGRELGIDGNYIYGIGDEAVIALTGKNDLIACRLVYLCFYWHHTICFTGIDTESIPSISCLHAGIAACALLYQFLPSAKRSHCPLGAAKCQRSAQYNTE